MTGGSYMKINVLLYLSFSAGFCTSYMSQSLMPPYLTDLNPVILLIWSLSIYVICCYTVKDLWVGHRIWQTCTLYSWYIWPSMHHLHT